VRILCHSDAKRAADNPMHLICSGEQQGFSDQPRQILAQGIIEPLQIVGLSRVFSTRAMLSRRNLFC
jgi:hypothetical protein